MANEYLDNNKKYQVINKIKDDCEAEISTIIDRLKNYHPSITDVFVSNRNEANKTKINLLINIAQLD